MRFFLLFLICCAAECLPGQAKIDYRYREPFPTIDTLKIEADYYSENGFEGFVPVLMICTGKVVPAIMNNQWGSTRCYDSIRVCLPDGTKIPYEKIVMFYGIDEDYAGWRPD